LQPQAVRQRTTNTKERQASWGGRAGQDSGEVATLDRVDTGKSLGDRRGFAPVRTACGSDLPVSRRRSHMTDGFGRMLVNSEFATRNFSDDER
jgi:hypothetical protein